MSILHGLAAVVMPTVLVLSALSDVRAFRIPNWHSLLLAAVFPMAALSAGLGWETLGWHVAAGAAVLVGGITLFALNVWGGGDAKLLAALALWTGWPGLPALLLWTAIAGGVVALAVLLWKRLRRVNRKGADCSAEDEPANNGRVPYALAIAYAGFHVLFTGQTVVRSEFFLS